MLQLRDCRPRPSGTVHSAGSINIKHVIIFYNTEHNFCKGMANAIVVQLETLLKVGSNVLFGCCKGGKYVDRKTSLCTGTCTSAGVYLYQYTIPCIAKYTLACPGHKSIGCQNGRTDTAESR